MLEVLALRRRGLTGPIRVTAENLPGGIECPEIWIGPGVDRAPLIFSAARECPSLTCNLTLVGHADLGGTEVTRAVCGGTMIWPGQPMPSGRLTGDVSLATGPEAPLLLTAFPGEAAVDQESVLDVAVDIERRIEGPTAAVHLTGVGLPELVANEVATIPAGQNKGWISFYVPASLLPGPYTFALQAETVLPQARLRRAAKSGVPVTLVSNPITIHVAEARIGLEIDPRRRNGSRGGRSSNFVSPRNESTASSVRFTWSWRRRGSRRVAGTRGNARRPVRLGKPPSDRHRRRPARPPTLLASGSGGHRGGPARLPCRPLCRAGDHRMMTQFVLVTCRLAGLGRIAVCVSAFLATPAATANADEFLSDVVPLLTKLGCNSGGCHGKATGQNGFKLSLLGFEPDQDYEAIVQEARGRRLFPAAPSEACCCSRPPAPCRTAADGGPSSARRITRPSLRWIEQGARPAAADDPVLERITVTPERRPSTRAKFDNRCTSPPISRTARVAT